MKKTRTRSPGGEASAPSPLATVQLPLPLLDVLADTRTAFFGLCLEAGQQVLLTMMEGDRTQLCGPAHVPDPQRRAYRHGKVAGEVTLGGRRVLIPRLRARSVDGTELVLPSFAYAANRDPLDAHTLAARPSLSDSQSAQRPRTSSRDHAAPDRPRPGGSLRAPGCDPRRAAPPPTGGGHRCSWQGAS
jgi:hypothetical protein